MDISTLWLACGSHVDRFFGLRSTTLEWKRNCGAHVACSSRFRCPSVIQGRGHMNLLGEAVAAGVRFGNLRDAMDHNVSKYKCVWFCLRFCWRTSSEQVHRNCVWTAQACVRKETSRAPCRHMFESFCEPWTVFGTEQHKHRTFEKNMFRWTKLKCLFWGYERLRTITGCQATPDQ